MEDTFRILNWHTLVPLKMIFFFTLPLAESRESSLSWTPLSDAGAQITISHSKVAKQD